MNSTWKRWKKNVKDRAHLWTLHEKDFKKNVKDRAHSWTLREKDKKKNTLLSQAPLIVEWLFLRKRERHQASLHSYWEFLSPGQLTQISMLRPLKSVLGIEALYSHSGMRWSIRYQIIRDPRWLRCVDNKKKNQRGHNCSVFVPENYIKMLNEVNCHISL